MRSCRHTHQACNSTSMSQRVMPGGQRACGGAPPNEALLHTSGNVPALACAWAPSCAAGGTVTPHFNHHLVSCCVNPCVSHPHPHGLFHHVFYAILSFGILSTKLFISYVHGSSGVPALSLSSPLPTSSFFTTVQQNLSESATTIAVLLPWTTQ